MEKPLLYKNRKFDIRVWAFAHSTLDFYFYDVGYLRTSSAEYTMDDTEWSNLQHMDKSKPTDDLPVEAMQLCHLTNNSIAYKNKDTFGMHEEGNVVNFGEFQTYLNENYP